MTMDPSTAFALDVNSVSRLKHSKNPDSAQHVRQVSQQFSAMFIQQMLKSMRAAIPKGGLLDSQQGDIYQQMLDAQWSQTMARRGIGLADMLTRQLEARGRVKGGTEPAGTGPLAGIAHADPKPLGPSEPVAARNAASAAPQAGATGKTDAIHPLVDRSAPAQPLFTLAAANAPGGNDTTSAHAGTPDYVRHFVERMGTAPSRAARVTGLPRRLILAQAALESGWGRHEIPAASGGSSHNVFNIKATGWQGARASADTTEFVNGTARTTRAGFRVYGSYNQAFDDYARLLSESPRYAPVLRATTARAAAQALQDCGYATDPAYADKLVAIMQQIPTAVSSAPEPLVAGGHARPLVNGVGAAAGQTAVIASNGGAIPMG